MTGRDVLAILDRLDAAGIAWWIEGGWGVDALIGEETRPHDDLDLAILRGDLERLALTLPEFRCVDEEWWPARFVLLAPDGRQLDAHPVDADEQGTLWQTLLDGTRCRRLREEMDHEGRVGGRVVRCIGADLQIAFHDYPDPDDVDWDDVRVLHERFAVEPPPAYDVRPGFVDEKRSRARPRLP